MNPALLQALPTRIGDALTRLPTMIHFDPVMLEPPAPRLHCTLGLPPQHLRAVHWPALVDACAARIQSAMARPVQIERAGRLRRVLVLGALIYERLPGGQYRLCDWRPGEVIPDQDGGHHVALPWLRPVPDDNVTIDGAPYKALWMTCYADGLRQALQLQWPGHPQIDPYVDWVMHRLKRHFWTDSAQQRVRAQVASALRLDSKVLQRARRWLAKEDGSPIRIADYNKVLWRRQQWPSLKTESPQWLPLLAQLWRHLPTTGEPLANLRALLLSKGVSPAMWRLLHREGTGWLWQLRNYYTKESQRSGRAALELVLKAQKFGTRQLVPVWMLQALMNLDGNPNRPAKSYLKNPEDPIDAPMAARLGQWAADMVRSGDEPGLQRLHGQCHLLLDWAMAHPTVVTSRVLRQVSLQGLWTRARRWHQQQLAKARQGSPWRLPFDLTAVQHDDLELVLLGSAVDVLEEAFAMHHCADSYVDRCARGSYVLLSVRRKDTGKRVATVGVTWDDGGLQLHQMAGFANALVPAEIRALAQRAVQCMHRQTRRPPAPKNDATSPTERRRLADKNTVKPT